MKNRAGKLAALVLALIMGIVTLTGCMEVNGERVAVIVGDEKYPVSEAQIYFYYEQYLTEVGMSSLVGTLFGSYESYWSFDTDDFSAVDTCLEAAMQMMVQTKVLYMEAQKAGITLTEEEQELVTKAVNKMMRDQSEFVNVSGATKDELTQFMTENALANKAYMYLTADMSTEVDYEEVRRKRVCGVTIMPRTETDDDGNEIEQDPDEQQALVQQYSDEILAKLREDQDVATLETEYGENEDVIVTKIENLNQEKPEEYEEGTISSYDDLAWSLSTGESNQLVMLNAQDKYVSYVFYCLDDDDEEFSTEATETLLEERRVEYFSEVYEDVLKKYRKIHVYLETVQNFSIGETLYSDDGSSYYTY